MHHHQSNSKRSYTEMADATDAPFSSNPILSSVNYSQCSNTISNGQSESAEVAAMAEACLQPPQLHVPLPDRVQQLLNRICIEKEKPQPDAEVTRKLGLLNEAKALELLVKIFNSKTPIRNLNGYIKFLLGQEEYQCSPASPSPSKSAPAASRLQSPPSSASPISPLLHQEHSGDYGGQTSAPPSKAARTSLLQSPSSASLIPPARQDHGGLRPPHSYSSAYPSKAARASIFHGASSAAPPIIVPVQLFMDPPLPQPQGSATEYGRRCTCGRDLYFESSWTPDNPTRRFETCSKCWGHKGCSSFELIDPELKHDYSPCNQIKAFEGSKDREIICLEEKLSREDREIMRFEEKLSSKDKEIMCLGEKLSSKDTEIACLEEKLSTKDTEITCLEEKLSTKDIEIKCLREKLRSHDSKTKNCRSKATKLWSSLFVSGFLVFLLIGNVNTSDKWVRVLELL